MTIVGMIFISLGLIAFICSDKWLYAMLILSAPFSATGVLSIGGEGNVSGVQLWMYFGSLWLLRELGLMLINPQRRFPRALCLRDCYVVVFVALLAFSLLMPLYINGSLQIASKYLLDTSTAPLYLNARNITSLLYMIFGTLLSFFIANRNLNPEQFRCTEKLYFSAGLAVAALGLLEFIAGLLHVPSPTLLLHNISSEPDIGAVLGGGFQRISSVAVEPSILCQFIVTVLPLSLPAWVGKGYVFSRRLDRNGSLLILTVFLLSTSTTAFVCILILPVLAIPILHRWGLRLGQLARSLLLAMALLAVSMTLLYLFSPLGRTILDEILIFKTEGYSALERAKTIQNALGYFMQYPLLGVGWGSITSHDLVAMLLGSSGVLGLLTFLWMLWNLGGPLYRGIRWFDAEAIRNSRAVWLLAGIFLLFASSISEFPYVFGHMWIVLAMTLSLGLRGVRAPDKHCPTSLATTMAATL